MGKRFVIRTLYANVITSIALIWMAPMPPITSSEVLIVLYGGFFLGVGIVYSIEKAMFSIAIFFIVSKTVDFILDGLNQEKAIMIISTKPDEVGKRLIQDLDAQLTYLYGEGGYSNEKRKVIYCITSRFLYPKLKELVLSIDSDAVLEASIVTETTGVKNKWQSKFF